MMGLVLVLGATVGNGSVSKSNLECMVVNIFVDVEARKCIKCVRERKSP